jgi:hypothetical protein
LDQKSEIRKKKKKKKNIIENMKFFLSAALASAAMARPTAFPADSSSIPWTNGTMYGALKLARAGYCYPADVKTWTCASCYGNVTVTDVVVAPKTGGQAFVAWDNDHSVGIVSYRGSVEFINYLYDFDFPKTALAPWAPNVTGVEVHRGFKESLLDLDNAGLTDAVRRLLSAHPGAPLLVTGHSMGAAFAGLAAYGLHVNLGARVTAITFGEPRVGNRAFSELVASLGRGNAAVWRVVNARDIVPHLPLKPVMDFYHLGEEIWRKGAHDWRAPTTKPCDGSGEDPTCSDSIGIADPITGVFDHTHYFGPLTGCNTWPDGDGPAWN